MQQALSRNNKFLFDEVFDDSDELGMTTCLRRFRDRYDRDEHGFRATYLEYGEEKISYDRLYQEFEDSPVNSELTVSKVTSTMRPMTLELALQAAMPRRLR